MIKECVDLRDGRWRCVIRGQNYNHHLNRFLVMFETAREDFPSLNTHEVEVMHYGGDRFRKTWGIEWTIHTIPPETYLRIRQVEPTL